ncbi:MAG: class I SAM-dependent methyltransferase [Candidatus Eiseniibacteriota bacterium]
MRVTSSFGAAPGANVGEDAGASELAGRVAGFYREFNFPSRTSHPAYERLLPQAHGELLGDFGSGVSIFHEALRGYRPAPVFLDISGAALRAIEYGRRVQADLHDVPFPDATFHRILCVGVLHHLPDPERPLREIARVLRPAGIFVLGVYAPGTLPAFLRSLHDRSSFRPWRRFVFASTRAMLRLRYGLAGRPIGSADADARTRDFLEVPFVRYVETGAYRRLAADAGLIEIETRRLSAMNIITYRKGDSAA